MANHSTEQRERYEAYLEENLKNYPDDLKRVLRNKVMFSHFENDADFLKVVKAATDIHDKQVSADEIKDGMEEISYGTNASKQLNTQLKSQKKDEDLTDEVFKLLKI
ncbi:hypothetical protein ACFOWA_13205 [Pedobacter lithocola]|uniref:Uncharacterized protein n=1 Tax=Pedobacter lithocola TaxID=1908239 RepID=A0ABV8PCV8_9SPHI